LTYTGASSTSLDIANVQYVNAAKYHVRVSNDSGTVLDSADARLHAVSTPGLAEPVWPSAFYPIAGVEKVLLSSSMNVTVPGPLYYQRTKNGIPIANQYGQCATLVTSAVLARGRQGSGLS
jgi:hypothetical protein